MVWGVVTQMTIGIEKGGAGGQETRRRARGEEIQKNAYYALQ